MAGSLTNIVIGSERGFLCLGCATWYGKQVDDFLYANGEIHSMTLLATSGKWVLEQSRMYLILIFNQFYRAIQAMDHEIDGIWLAFALEIFLLPLIRLYINQIKA